MMIDKGPLRSMSSPFDYSVHTCLENYTVQFRVIEEFYFNCVFNAVEADGGLKDLANKG